MAGRRFSLDMASLAARYRSGDLDPSALIADVLERISRRGDDKVWIDRLDEKELLDRAATLEKQGPEGLPLYGIPFAIKDNIDFAGHPTTAGCPEYAYVADESASVVRALLDAGAVMVGKTNLDQFATGLVGVRSPYGACANPFDPAYLAGGSSSGSAVAVAAGLVSFSLGTDTAGSGRVPAAFTNIVGLKPTRGLLSSSGVVPACRSLDCVSVFALCAADARAVFGAAARFDPADPFSRRAATEAGWVPGRDGFGGVRFGVPRADALEFFGNEDAAGLFSVTVSRLAAAGAAMVEIDFAPFLEAARLLYEGPWVAERYVAIREFIERQPEALHPVTRRIIEGGAKLGAADAFAAYYRLKELRRETAPAWATIDALLTPTAGTIYTIAEIEADPIRLNSNLGYYTNFMNLLDLSAIAVPAGFQANGLPFGVTLSAPAFHDGSLCALGDLVHRSAGLTMGATGDALPPTEMPALPARGVVRLAVNGAHMSGLPLNCELTERGGRLVRACHTAADYRLFALDGFAPPRPGLVRRDPGCAIAVEVWDVPEERFGGFVAGIPAPLGIGTVVLEDGEQVRGFLCEPYALEAAEDISELGGWRRYLAGKS